MSQSRGKSEIARVQGLGAKCFHFKVNNRLRTLYSHDDAGTFTNRRIAMSALQQQQPPVCQLDVCIDHSVDAADFVDFEATRSNREVLVLDSDTNVTLCGEDSDFVQWSIDACGDSDRDPSLDDDSSMAWLLEDVVGTSVADVVDM